MQPRDMQLKLTRWLVRVFALGILASPLTAATPDPRPQREIVDELVKASSAAGYRRLSTVFDSLQKTNFRFKEITQATDEGDGTRKCYYTLVYMGPTEPDHSDHSAEVYFTCIGAPGALKCTKVRLSVPMVVEAMAEDIRPDGEIVNELIKASSDSGWNSEVSRLIDSLGKNRYRLDEIVQAPGVVINNEAAGGPVPFYISRGYTLIYRAPNERSHTANLIFDIEGGPGQFGLKRFKARVPPNVSFVPSEVSR